MDVQIIGGAGHVGLPLGVILAESGHTVTLIDQDEERLSTVEHGDIPFKEPGGEKYLAQALENGRLSVTSELAAIDTADAIISVIGTPIDEHHNPQMNPLLNLIDELIPHLGEGELFILRSTVYPGTTNIVAEKFEEEGLAVGEDVYLSFAPERIAQHKAFDELIQLPQLIGGVDKESYSRTESLFDTFLEGKCLALSPTEAELGKLFTNMWRYLTFAAANEFYLISETFSTHHDVNIHRILEKTKEDYPRFDVPTPGANVGGPCLTKDGWFLVNNIPFNELVSAAYQINEGMPSQIIQRMARECPKPEKVGILGMTFKPGSDDIRNSVSFKLKQELRMRGIENIVALEPNRTGFDDWEALNGCGWVILMTPHEEFSNLSRVHSYVRNENCLYCDVWGFWDELKHDSDNGYFLGSEIPKKQEVELNQ